MLEIIPNWHPAFVHYPIAFATAAVVFIAIGMAYKNRSWAMQCLMTGRWMLWGAALFGLLAAAFGWFAYSSIEHDEVGHAAMILHRNWALGALAALLALASWDAWQKRSGKMPSQLFLGLLVATWLLVTSTAWHGAELVYRHGLGVTASPDVHAKQDTAPHNVEEHEHEHTH